MDTLKERLCVIRERVIHVGGVNGVMAFNFGEMEVSTCEGGVDVRFFQPEYPDNPHKGLDYAGCVRIIVQNDAVKASHGEPESFLRMIEEELDYFTLCQNLE